MNSKPLGIVAEAEAIITGIPYDFTDVPHDWTFYPRFPIPKPESREVSIICTRCGMKGTAAFYDGECFYLSSRLLEGTCRWPDPDTRPEGM